MLALLRTMLLLSWLAAPMLADELSVDAEFSNGSAEVESIDQATRTIRLRPTSHPNRGWDCWWYLKITGITPGETITLDVGEAPWATPSQAAYSLDNQHWQQTAIGQRKGKRIVYQQKIDADHAWFAWGPPFRVEDAQQLVDTLAAESPFATKFELCQTRAGRSVPGLIVREAGTADKDRLGIWIQARQHAWESGSSWVCAGLTRWLLSDDPRAQRLRQTAEITIIPIMDIDNVAIGAGGKNQVPQDHNRDWTDQPHWNSVKAAMAQIQKKDQAGQFDLFVDLHNPDAGAKHPFYFITTKDLLTEVGAKNLERFVATSQLEINGPLAFQGKTRESGPNYDKNWQSISKNWVTVHTADHVVAVTLETAWNTPASNTDGYQTVGRQLGLAIERYFRTPN